MFDKLNALRRWLINRGLKSEAKLVSEAMAGRPLPINRAEVDDIVDELLSELNAKLLAYSINPINIFAFLTGQFQVDPSAFDALTVSVDRKKKNIKGDDIEVTYAMMFSDDPSLVPAQVGSANEEGTKKELVLGVNPNSKLMGELKSYLDSNIDKINNEVDDHQKSFKHLDNLLRGYLRELIRHEEVHVVDKISARGGSPMSYVVKEGGPKTLSQISKNLQINLRGLFLANIKEILESHNSSYIYEDLTNAISRAQMSGDESDINEIYDEVINIELNDGFEVKYLKSAESQFLPKEGETIRGAAKRMRVDPVRLLVVNFNKIFKPTQLFTFQQIYEMPRQMLEQFLDTDLSSEEPLALIPSYDELYSYDHGFYLITREESKAHYEQAIFNIEQAIKGMSKEDVEAISLEEMLDMSHVAKKYVDFLKEPNPVDSIIKTPIYGKTLDQLKRERYKEFMQRMHYYWSENIQKTE